MDDPGDLARLCRTCRVLNYMALPQLYRNLILTSYDKIRYRDDQPEGMGSASPFTMGLNAVITRPYALLVRSLTLRGDWREQELEEHARVGRVPDSSMMLNIAVRAAIDKMQDLEAFRWELSTKMLETVYMGLAQLPKLTSLTLRFPSSRHPRPTSVIPAMPHLRYLKITDIDPLCYPDDISTLLFKARKLKELKMHWSPRMRNMQEPSVMLHDYFRKCISARRPLTVRNFGMSNLYARHSDDFNTAIDATTVEEVTMLSEVRSDLANTNTFVDSTWPAAPHTKPMHLKSLRANIYNQRQSEFLGSFTGLEKLYLIGSASVDNLNSPRELAPCPTLTPPASEGSRDLVMPADSPSNLPSLQARVRDLSMNSIILNHAATLRHLLLPARWPLSSTLIARLVHASPQLEQLAFAAEVSSMDTLGLLLPFLRNLQALRLLVPTSISPPEDQSHPQPPKSSNPSNGDNNNNGLDLGARSLADFVELDDDILAEKLGESLADQQLFQRLKVLGVGRKGFLLGEYFSVPVEQTQPRGVQSQTPAASRAPSVEDRSPLSFVELEGNANAHVSANINATAITNANGIANGPASNTGLPSPGQAQAQAQSHTHTHNPHIQTTSSPNLSQSHYRHRTNHHHAPPSTLGKRPRDEDSSIVHIPGAQNQNTPHGNSNSNSNANANGNNQDPNQPLIWYDCAANQILGNPRNRALRRRVHRVGWDVLRKWEVWGLDTQEL